MPGPAFLHGERVVLRTTEREDVEFLQRAWNEPAIRRSLGTGGPSNLEQMEEGFEEHVSGEEGVNLLVCLGEEPVGSVSLFDVYERSGNGKLAVWIAPEHQGNGYATDAARTLVDYAFDERRLHRVRAQVFDFNDASRRIWEKLGFEHEGRLRENRFVDGEYVDEHEYGLLAAEWDG